MTRKEAITRKETTKMLTDILINDRLSDRKYYAKEVTVDYGTNHPKRVDVMEFSPQGVTYVSDIEKGKFICYEIKSCKADIYSGNGLNFFGEKNYLVMTMQTYKDFQSDLRDGTFTRYLMNNHPESSCYYGIMVPVPRKYDLSNTDQMYECYENPPVLENDEVEKWHLYIIQPCREGYRKRCTSELLFCMLRSKHSYTNNIKD